MNVLLSGLSVDRIENHTLAALHAAGVNLYAIANPASPAVDLAKSLSIPCREFRFTSRVQPSGIRLYRAIFAETGPFDIVHALTNDALANALLATWTLKNPPKIVAYRGTMGHISRFDPASWLAYLNPRISAIICVSHAVRRYLAGFGIPKSRLPVVWKGHDPAWYPPPPPGTLDFLALPPGAVTVCFTGNMRPVKGVPDLLDAFAGIPPESNIHLVLVGEVRDPAIARRVGQQPNVHFLGFRKDATAIAGSCDISVMPSVEREGLAKATLEAMSQGIPAIVSNVGGLPEVVEDGVSGLVVPPRNPAALREAILRLAKDPALRATMGAAAAARIAGPFHFSHTPEKTLAVYKAVLEQPPR